MTIKTLKIDWDFQDLKWYFRKLIIAFKVVISQLRNHTSIIFK